MGILLSFNFLALGCWLSFCKVCMDVLLHQRAPRGRSKPLNPEQQAAACVCMAHQLLVLHARRVPCQLWECSPAVPLGGWTPASWSVQGHRGACVHSQGSRGRKSRRAPGECHPVSGSDGHEPGRGLVF